MRGLARIWAWGAQLQRSMRPLRVVVHSVPSEDPAEVLLAEDQRARWVWNLVPRRFRSPVRVPSGVRGRVERARSVRRVCSAGHRGVVSQVSIEAKAMTKLRQPARLGDHVLRHLPGRRRLDLQPGRGVGRDRGSAGRPTRRRRRSQW